MKQSAVEWYIENVKLKEIEYLDDKITTTQLDVIINNLGEQAKEMEKEQNEKVICKHCDKPISVDDINNHLFMNIKGGGLIHWNCETV